MSEYRNISKKAIRIVHSKSPIAHTEPILKTMNQLKLSDMYTCHLLKLYYKLYRNRLPTYFENFIPEYGESSHNLRNRHIHLPDFRCEFVKLNAKYQMHLRLRELAIPPNPPIYPLIDINDDILSKSLSYFSGYIKSMFTSSYIFECNIYITVMYVKIQIRLYFVICYLIMHIVHNMCQSPTSAALAVSCVFHIKLF